MSNPSKARGTAWETAIVTYLRNFTPHVERRACNGNQDRGDIAGIPGVVIEAKNAKAITLAAWLDEANTERDNDHAELGVVWIKRRGHTNPGDGYVVMDGVALIGLLHAAGYLPDTSREKPA